MTTASLFPIIVVAALLLHRQLSPSAYSVSADHQSLSSDAVLLLSSEEIGKMSLGSRVKYLKAFMRQKRMAAANEEEKHPRGLSVVGTNNPESNLAAPANDRCTPNQKFYRCCIQIQGTCTFADADAVMAAACRYPPDDLNMQQQICLSYYLNEYIMCYGDGQDNSACCDRAGVEKDCVWGLIFHADCRDFCRSNHQLTTAKPGYHCCTPYAPKIAECNKQSSNMNTDTAAVKYGFCKRHCFPPWPEYCKQSSSSKKSDDALMSVDDVSSGNGMLTETPAATLPKSSELL